jgi:hypothetical protein
MAATELPPVRLASLVDEVRQGVPATVFARLPPPSTSAVLSAKRLLEVIAAHLSAGDPAGVAALEVWLTAARAAVVAEVPGRTTALAGALTQPGRDPAIGPFVPERTKVGAADDLVDVNWLQRGAVAAAAVAYIEVCPHYGLERRGAEAGTAFLIDPRHVMTAFHVIEQRDVASQGPAAPDDLARQVASARVAFDYTAPPSPGAPRGTPIGVEALVAFDRELDYAVLRLPAAVAAEPARFSVAALPPVDHGLTFVANIVQHPMREPKRLGLRNNAVWRVDDKHLYYFTDTRGGTSGAPVFNDAWCVIAIHTGWQEFAAEDPIYMGRKVGFANRGTRAARLVRSLREHSARDPTLGLALAVTGE